MPVLQRSVSLVPVKFERRICRPRLHAGEVDNFDSFEGKANDQTLLVAVPAKRRTRMRTFLNIVTSSSGPRLFLSLGRCVAMLEAPLNSSLDFNFSFIVPTKGDECEVAVPSWSAACIKQPNDEERRLLRDGLQLYRDHAAAEGPEII